MMRKLGISRFFVLLEELPVFAVDGSPELRAAGGEAGGDGEGSCAALRLGKKNRTASMAGIRVFIRQFVLF
jgi:hypothetical protein